jgi:hypothetical protein
MGFFHGGKDHSKLRLVLEDWIAVEEVVLTVLQPHQPEKIELPVVLLFYGRLYTHTFKIK